MSLTLMTIAGWLIFCTYFLLRPLQRLQSFYYWCQNTFYCYYYLRLPKADQERFAFDCFKPLILKIMRAEAQQEHPGLAIDQQAAFAEADEAFLKYLLKTYDWDLLLPPRPHLQDTSTAPALLPIITLPEAMLEIIKNIQDSRRPYSTAKMMKLPNCSFAKHIEFEWNDRLNSAWLKYVRSRMYVQHLEDYLFNQWLQQKRYSR